MSRGQGRVYRPTNDRGQRSPFWSIVYSIGGKRHYESSKSKKKSVAQRLLRQRMGDRESGKIIGDPRKVTLAQLRALVERQYALDGNKSLARVKLALGHLEDYFGAKCRVAEIKPVELDSYAEQRVAAGRARSTINYELAALRRGFSLAIRKGLLSVGPSFDLPKVANARQGFFGEGEIAAVLLELPPDVRDLVQGLAALGWRRDELRLLQWANVDRDGGIIRLEEARSKSGKPRIFPFGLAPSLQDLFNRRWEQRSGLFVFHRDGQALSKDAIRAAWARATKRAGLAGMLLHDLRRSAARAFRKAGVSEGEIMQLCGWETRAMFDRYNIIDEADRAAAVAKRFSETTAKPSAPESNPHSVSPSNT